MLFVIISLLLSVFYLCLLFLSVWLQCVLVGSSLTVSCLGLSTLPGLDWLFPFLCYRNFHLFSLQIFFGSFSVSPPSGTPIMWILIQLILSQRPLSLSSLKKKILYSVLSQWFLPFCLAGHVFILMPWNLQGIYY